ncbi:hypothetical protein RCL1_005475 [Eukaryota sp. TZLM3-RCL]
MDPKLVDTSDASPDVPQLSPEDARFYEYVEALQHCVLDDSFSGFLTSFQRRYCHLFSSDEHPIEAMNIFQEYNKLADALLDQLMAEKVPNYSFDEFVQLLNGREAELDEDLFEMLDSIIHFESFCQFMQEINAAPSLDDLIVISHS